MMPKQAVFRLKGHSVELAMEGFQGAACEKEAEQILKEAGLEPEGPAQYLPEYYSSEQQMNEMESE